MTVIINAIPQWQTLRNSVALQNKTIGFVPTMGNLHHGHQSLLQRSVAENELTILSIFVNPTQFNNQIDLANYPRTLENDITLAEQVGVDVIFMPNYEELYADNYRYKVTELEFSKILCGAHRPGHFDGVLTVVLKLLLLVQARHAYFGEKDYQQLLLVKNMCEAFFISTKIIACPTIRADSGLALSSRNNLLLQAELTLAAEFSRLLKLPVSTAEISAKLAQCGFQVDYIEEHGGRRFGAVTLGKVRLIDNVAL